MATYLELYSLRSDSDLQDKVSVAVTKKAQTILDSASPTSEAISWANDAIENPRGKAMSLLNYVLATHSDESVTIIKNASDSQIQTAVDMAVDAIISGGA